MANIEYQTEGRAVIQGDKLSEPLVLLWAKGHPSAKLKRGDDKAINLTRAQLLELGNVIKEMANDLSEDRTT